MEKGQTINMVVGETITERLACYDWYSNKTYKKNFPGENGKTRPGHVQMKHNGEDGVAVYQQRSDCVRVELIKTTQANRTTVMAATVNEQELFPCMLDLAPHETRG